MNRISKFAAAGVVGIAATTLSAVPATAATPFPHTQHTAGAGTNVVFVQNDNARANTVFAYKRTADGGLKKVGAYRTGGKGGALTGSAVDHLASQGSLAYDAAAHLLIAVNAGSDTITTFAVRGDTLSRVQILQSGGSFPVSVAARGNLVYVLNARDGGSISGFVEVAGLLAPVPSWHRNLHLKTLKPGNPNEFVATPAQVGFSPNGSQLVVATKQGGESLEVFKVSLSGLSAKPVVTELPGTVPFGFAFDSQGNLAVTEAGPSAVVTFSLSKNGKATQLDSAATGQAATCWLAVSGATLYASNAGSGDVSLYTSDAQGQLTGLGTQQTDAGTVDAAASSDGQYLYVQTGAAGIVDAFSIASDGSLTETGTVTVPRAVGGEGIVAL